MVARTVKTPPETTETEEALASDTTPASEVMNMDRVPNVAVAMSEAMHHVRAVAKGGFNAHQKFKFRGIDDVMNAVGPALRKAHVVIVPSRIISHDMQTAATSGGKSTNAVRVHVEYTIYGPAGDSIKMEAVGEAQDTADKGTAKAMSVAYRTLLLQAFTLPTDDPDPDSENAEPYTREPVPSRHGNGAAPAARPPAPTWSRDAVQGGISAANGDVAALRAFYDEAKAGGCPEQGLVMIQKAGEAAAQFARNRHDTPPAAEKTHTLEDLKKAGAVQTGSEKWGGDVPAALDPTLDPTSPDPDDPIDADAEAAWLAQNGG